MSSSGNTLKVALTEASTVADHSTRLTTFQGLSCLQNVKTSLKNETLGLFMTVSPRVIYRMPRFLSLRLQGISSSTTRTKIYQHAANFNLFLPIWSLAELLEVGRTIHGFSEAHLSAVTTKYTQFGGIARYVFGEGYSVSDKTKKNPISRALSVSALIRAFGDVGSSSLDHSSTSGVLVHLIPDTPAYNSFTFQWGKYIYYDEKFRQTLSS